MTKRWIRFPLSLFILLPLAGCPASPPPPTREEIKTTTNVATEDPCRGAALELHALKDRCNIKRRGNLLHPQGLAASIVPSPVKLPMGAQVQVVVRFTNTRTTPLEIIMGRGCGAFSSDINDAKGAPADLDGVAPDVGGLCASMPPVKVTLEPAGYLDAQVPVSGLKKKWVSQGSAFVITPGPPIAPGKYILNLQSPYVERSGKGEQIETARLISAPLEITQASD